MPLTQPQRASVAAAIEIVSTKLTGRLARRIACQCPDFRLVALS